MIIIPKKFSNSWKFDDRSVIFQLRYLNVFSMFVKRIPLGRKQHLSTLCLCNLLLPQVGESLKRKGVWRVETNYALLTDIKAASQNEQIISTICSTQQFLPEDSKVNIYFYLFYLTWFLGLIIILKHLLQIVLIFCAKVIVL